MNIDNISDLFERNGGLVAAAGSEHIHDFSSSEVISLFENRGIIIFRGFSIDGTKLTEVTDIYTESYSPDATYRNVRFGQTAVRSVEKGTRSIPLHSEAAFSPSWPELVWFYCNVAPQCNGQTTLCDGVKLWKTLSSKTKKYFLANPIQYTLKIPFATSDPTKTGRREWGFSKIGTSEAYIDFDDNNMYLTQTRYAVQEGRLAGELCFANYLLAGEEKLISKKTVGGIKIPQCIIDEVRENAENLIYEIMWRSGDLLMVDNRRMMHGRRAFSDTDERDIVVVQSLRASFGYGSTTRSAKKTANSATV